MILPSLETTRSIALAGVALIGAAGTVPQAEAATLTSGYQTFFLSQPTAGTANGSLSFDTFDSALGTLTGVTFDLDSYIGSGEAMSVTAAFVVDAIEFSQSGEGPYDLPALDPVAAGASLAFFEGDGTTPFSVELKLSVVALPTGSGSGVWCGGAVGCDAPAQGMRVTYQYEPTAVSAPGTWILLFGAGLASLLRPGNRTNRVAGAG